MRPTQDLLLTCHRELDVMLRKDRRRCFVSGWQIENPHATDYLDMRSLVAEANESASYYRFLSDARDVADSISRFHKTRDLVSYSHDEIFATAGASPLILATMTTLHAHSVRTIHYFPPVYYAFFYWAKVFGIEMIPITETWPALDPLELPLPESESVLLFSDPAWVVGRFVDADLIHAIKNWQARTRSLVFVDGTFQYTKWDTSERAEFTAQLQKGKTIRLICPTKSVGVNGIRFAYLLLPAELREDIRYAASNSSGAADGISVAAASCLMSVLNSENGNRPFIDTIRSRSEALTGILHDAQPWQPNCTYYVFSRLLASSEECLTMDQRFFEGPQYPGVRINLLVPQTELDKISTFSPSHGRDATPFVQPDPGQRGRQSAAEGERACRPS